jgi:hypothetical protein
LKNDTDTEDFSLGSDQIASWISAMPSQETMELVLLRMTEKAKALEAENHELRARNEALVGVLKGRWKK